MSRKRKPMGPQRRRVAESVAAPERTTVAEAGVAEVSKERPGRMLVRLIKAGWSLNGNYYPAEVLKRDGAAAWPKGTQAFIDHATETEEYERPAGSVEKLAGIQTEDARWDEDTKSLVAWTRLFEPWRTPLIEMAKAEAEEGIPVIGMSIRAYVTAEHGERDGRKGNIVNTVEQGRSVDFVTKPAAGGALLDVLEAVQARKVAEASSVGTWLESRLHLALTQYADEMYGDGRLTRAERITLSSAIGDGLQAWTARVEADAPQLFQRAPWDEAPDGEVPAEEALTNDTRARLQRAVAAAHGSDDEDGSWVWDYDPDEQFVIYGNDDGTWRQAYTDEDGIALTGDPVEVDRRTTYVPVDTPTEEAAALTAPARLAVTEMAADLDRADQALKNSPTAATANADGSPPTALHPIQEGESTMSGSTTAEGVQPGPAGTPNGTPVAEEVAVVAAERDQFRTRCTALTEALSESQSAQRTAEARMKEALARLQLMEGNEAGRAAVDKALAENASGMPDSLITAITPRVHAAVNGRVPFTEDGQVNAEALTALVAASIKSEAGYAAAVLESQGAGRPSGLGGFVEGEGVPDFDVQLAEGFAELGLDENSARIAVKGR
ncbi:hypothetical protein [Glycomyces sp. NPDC021274]|uniref:hypothetical protein n=1 Tax=Glycomyces sp. NPDC021274 TaxID=3155120 RepID=UPI0033C7ECF2